MDLTSIPIEGTLLTALSATETTPLTLSPDMIREVKCNLDMTYFCTKGTMIPHRSCRGLPHAPPYYIQELSQAQTAVRHTIRCVLKGFPLSDHAATCPTSGHGSYSYMSQHMYTTPHS